jgi:hypothetical protein
MEILSVDLHINKLPVVTGDGHVDKVYARVGVAEGNTGDIDVGSFHDGLLIGTGVGDHKKSGFLEFLGILIGKGTGSPSTGTGGDGASVLGVFEDGSLSVGSGRHHDHVFGVVDSDDHSGSEFDLIKDGLGVDEVHSFLGSRFDVGLHLVANIFGTNVALGRQ